MLCLESHLEEYPSLPFHTHFAKIIPIAALNKEAEAMLWHQCLIHCCFRILKSVSLYVDGVPNLSAFNLNDILKCPTCLKTNCTKNFGKKSLRDSVKRPYQGLFIDFIFPGKVKREKEGVVIKANWKNVKGMNGETT